MKITDKEDKKGDILENLEIDEAPILAVSKELLTHNMGKVEIVYISSLKQIIEDLKKIIPPMD